MQNPKRLTKGAFTNYVYKRKGVGGQKKPNFVNVVYERPLRLLATKNSKYISKFIFKNMFY